MECEVSTVHIVEKTNFSPSSQTLIDGVARSNTSRNRCRVAQRMKVSIFLVLGETMSSHLLYSFYSLEVVLPSIAFGLGKPILILIDLLHVLGTLSLV